MKKMLSIILAAMMIVMLIQPVSSGAAYTSQSIPSNVVKIGLFYGDNALLAANLQNATGMGRGYRFGWFDENRQFVPVGQIPDVSVTMMSDQTVYLAADRAYQSGNAGAGFVGAYHVQLPVQYGSFEEAYAYATSLSNAFVAYVNGQYFVRTGDYATLADAQAAAGSAGGSAVGGSATGYTVVVTGSARILFEFDMQGKNLALEPVSDTGVKTETWFRGFTYYGAFEYRKVSGGNLTVINVLGMEDYIKGVIPWEMNAAWPIEALKAQALTARSYALHNFGKHASAGFDLCNTIDCQVYQGTKSASDNSDRAVDETAGMYITYNGEPIQAVYHASNGGATEDSNNVWYDNLPYLRAVRDDFEALTTTTNTSWGFEITLSMLTEILRARGNNVTSLRHAYAEYTAAGNVKRLVFVDSTGEKFTYEGERARIMLRSTSYGVEVKSQRFIFEDKQNPRVTSPSQLVLPAAGSLSGPQGTVPSGTGTGATALVNTGSAFVISAGSVIHMLTGKYGMSLPVLSKDGTTQVQSVYATADGSASGGSTTPTSPSDGTVQANALAIPTSSSGTFIVRGGGNGHNVGMSQFGAKGMAEAGYTAAQIIGYYYTGVRIDRMY